MFTPVNAFLESLKTLIIAHACINLIHLNTGNDSFKMVHKWTQDPGHCEDGMHNVE